MMYFLVQQCPTSEAEAGSSFPMLCSRRVEAAEKNRCVCPHLLRRGLSQRCIIILRSSATWLAGSHASPLREHFSPAQPVHIAPNVPQLYEGTASDGGAHAPFKNHTQLSSLKWCSQVAFLASSVRLCYYHWNDRVFQASSTQF